MSDTDDSLDQSNPHSISGHKDGNFVTTGDRHRFAGIPTFLRAPLVQDGDTPTIGIFGVPYDGGIIRTPGTRFGPRGIRNCCWRVEQFDPELGVNPFEMHDIVDFGDLILSPFSVDDAMESIEKGAAKLLDRDIVPIAIGGDHFITHPLLRAIHKKHGDVAVIHFDAHTDTATEAYGQKFNHGTMFRHAVAEGILDPKKFIQVGIRKVFGDDEFDFHEEHGIEVISAERLREIGAAGLKERFARFQGDKVYVTFDLDFVDAAHAPGVGSPELGGPSSSETMAAIRTLAGLDIIGFDLVEVAPSYDVRDLTCYLANLVLMAFVSMTPQRS
jgi:agmatinase